MASVIVTIVGQMQTLPAGTVAGAWQFTIGTDIGGLIGIAEETGKQHSFVVAPGVYHLTGQRLNAAGTAIGPQASADVIVPDAGVSIEVALSVSGSMT